MSAAFTEGPWHVLDLRASKMRELGWTGPMVDSILISTKAGAAVEDGSDCVIARVKFENRSEELREGNLADARLIAAAPSLYADAEFLCERLRGLESELDGDSNAAREFYGHVIPAIARMESALAEARGEQS